MNINKLKYGYKIKGRHAEQAVILKALNQGWGVLIPVGDRLPYDLIFDIKGALIKVQVKYAWFDSKSSNYVIDTRRTKTNRRRMIRKRYCPSDFDFALVYLSDLNIFYVFPVDIFIRYGSQIHMVESIKRQRKPKSEVYREAWNLIMQRAAHKETCA